MSQETKQFLELVRRAMNPVQFKEGELQLSFLRHCEICGKVTDHISTISGEWESLTCPCGHYTRFKTE